MSNRCPACGYENREQARFCAECRRETRPLSPTPAVEMLAVLVTDEAALLPVAAVADVFVMNDDAAAPQDIVLDGDAPQEPGRAPGAGCVTLVAGQRSDVGDARAGRPNEDSIFALTMTSVTNSQAHPSLGLYLVADGMGGHLDGDVASRTACGLISAHLLELLASAALQDVTPGSDTVVETLEQAIQAANQQINAAAVAANSNMGTTLVLALVVDQTVCVANAGDSRAYRWSGGGLRQITEDHSHVFLLRQNGVIEEDEIYTHPRRNEIYRSLGSAQAVEVDYFEDELAPGDLLLLCSDGLWEMLRNEGITDVLLLNLADPQAICDELVRRANGAGGDDNISVVVVRAVGGGRV